MGEGRGMTAPTSLNGIGLRLLAALLITAMSAMVAVATREVGWDRSCSGALPSR